METPELRSIDLLLPFVQGAPPWVVLSILVGIVSASAFFVVAGRGFRSLPTYLILGVAVAPLLQVAGGALPLLQGVDGGQRTDLAEHHRKTEDQLAGIGKGRGDPGRVAVGR